MPARASSIIAPLYLFACLLLGGSVQGIWSNLLLQLSAVAIIAWALIAGRKAPGGSVSLLRIIGVVALAIVALEVFPLPPQLWSALPGREPVVDGFHLMGMPLPWMPLSMAPERSLSTFLALLPAGAMFALILRNPFEKPAMLAVAAVAGMFVSVLVAVLQLTQGEAWYPYKIYSLGTPTGLFANTNHLAALILVSVPLIAALAAEYARTSPGGGKRKGLAIAVSSVVGVAVILLGVALNKSFAVLLLGGPIIAGSALIFLPAKPVRLDRLALLLLAMMALAAAAFLTIGSERLTRLAGQASVVERQQIWESSARMAVVYMPAGSGLGTFDKVYHLQEDPDRVGHEYVNHAHNDFIELVIELGLPGLALLLAFAIWWAVRFVDIWRSGHSSPMARAATLVSLALMAHSLVDFPLRPAALSALFATAIALMALSQTRIRTDQRGQPRHLKLEDLD
jgi:O-antigen ligase